MSEAKKEQPTVRSFRITENVMARFRSIMEDEQITQDAALKMLVDAYELEQAKQTIPSREKEISNFQAKAQELIEAFLYSLQLNQDAEARIRAELDLQMKSKDTALADCQAQLKTAKEKIGELRAIEGALAEAKAENNRLQLALQTKEADSKRADEQHAGQLADKDKLIALMQKELEIAKTKATGYDELKAERDSLAEALKATEEEAKEQKREYERQSERAGRAAEKAQDAAVAAVKEEANSNIAELKERLQTAQIEAERALRATEKEAAAEIRKLEQEISRLREQIAKLQP